MHGICSGMREVEDRLRARLPGHHLTGPSVLIELARVCYDGYGSVSPQLVYDSTFPKVGLKLITVISGEGCWLPITHLPAPFDEVIQLRIHVVGARGAVPLGHLRCVDSCVHISSGKGGTEEGGGGHYRSMRFGGAGGALIPRQKGSRGVPHSARPPSWSPMGWALGCRCNRNHLTRPAPPISPPSQSITPAETHPALPPSWSCSAWSERAPRTAQHQS